jgi:integrase
MAGQRLQIGEHGDISYATRRGRVTASLYYRNAGGSRRRLEATDDSKAAARRRLLAKLEEALSAGAAADYTVRTTLREVAERWHQQVADLGAAGQRSPTTVVLYRQVLDRHVLPALGSLLLSEVTTPRIDHFIQGVRRDRGYAVAKVCRSILSGVCGHAVRAGALRTNPVRDVARLEGQSRSARALTLEECRQWLEILDDDPFARRKDLPQLTRFLLGTGLRLGEALGLLWDDIDFDRQVIHVRRTVVRVEGQGLVAKAPKTYAGARVLRMPSWLAELLRRRHERSHPDAPVFPDSYGGYRDRNNVERDFRRVRAGTPFEWVVPHTYRKTVATLLDHQGLSARTIADQLGHSRISMTQDVYLGRRAVDGRAAAALDDILGVHMDVESTQTDVFE